MIYISLNGFTSPSTCTTSISSNALTIWNIPSTYYILLKNAFPKPWPSCAPSTNPAISIISNYAGTLDFGYHISHNLSYLVSGTGTYAKFGSIVQNGLF